MDSGSVVWCIFVFKCTPFLLFTFPNHGLYQNQQTFMSPASTVLCTTGTFCHTQVVLLTETEIGGFLCIAVKA